MDENASADADPFEERDAEPVEKASGLFSARARALVRDALADAAVATPAATRGGQPSHSHSPSDAGRESDAASDAGRASDAASDAGRASDAASLVAGPGAYAWLGVACGAACRARALEAVRRAIRVGGDSEGASKEDASTKPLVDDVSDDSSDASSDADATLLALRLEARDAADAFLATVEALCARARSRLEADPGALACHERVAARSRSSPSSPGGFTSPASSSSPARAVSSGGPPRFRHRSLLGEIAGRVASGADDEGACVDLEHAPGTLGGFLKSGVAGLAGLAGFGKGGKGGNTLVSGPRPSDSAVVFLFVVGGVTPGEVRDAREAAARALGGSGAASGVPLFGGDAPSKTREVLVGGTRILAEEAFLEHFRAE